MCRRTVAWMLAGINIASIPLFSQGLYRAVRDPASPSDIPYTRYYTKDRFARTITFYVSGDQSERLPLVVSVMGSGAYSSFKRSIGRILDAHRTQREVFGNRVHVLVVEKPGVEFLEQHANPGIAIDGSPEFRREHTEAVSASLRAAYTLPLADRTRCLLVGHSEGGSRSPA